jgi:hypothetical protein
MDSSMTLQESHAVIDRLERRAKNDMNIELVVHLDPVTVGDEKTDDLHQDITSYLATISPDLSIHDFQVDWGETTAISFDLVAPYHFAVDDVTLQQQVEEAVSQLGTNYKAQVVIDHQ